MNSSTYFDDIELKLSTHATRLHLRGSLNLLNLHLHSEDFYQRFINLLFGWQLNNLNAVQQNADGVDLVDKVNNIVAQVSATVTKRKVESALAKDLSEYKHCSFKFISICKDASSLRRIKKFMNPHGLRFIPREDIYDITSILSHIKGMNVDRLKEVYEFILKELKTEPDSEKIESNLASIIKILSKYDWKCGVSFEKIPFDIEAKISYNQLKEARPIIDDYKVNYYRIGKIYSDFDKQGANKSLSILNCIRSFYVELCSTYSPDQCFSEIIKAVAQKIRSSANYTRMPDEELILCVGILVVDAFVRCKIFKNPSEDNDVSS